MNDQQDEANLGFKVEKLWAYFSQGPGPNGSEDEGLVAWRGPDGGWLPLVGADPRREEQLDTLAQAMATIRGRTVKKVVFLERRDLRTFEP